MDRTIRMEARMTFAGDREEGLHPRGSRFWTTPARARKYHEAGLAIRLEERVEETVAVSEPHKPQEFKGKTRSEPSKGLKTPARTSRPPAKKQAARQKPPAKATPKRAKRTSSRPAGKGRKK